MKRRWAARLAPRRCLTGAAAQVATQDYYSDGSGKAPRCYQLQAINRTVEAIAKGQKRVLLVMATGTGKTYTAFQIIWRLWKSGAAKRILWHRENRSHRLLDGLCHPNGCSGLSTVMAASPSSGRVLAPRTPHASRSPRLLNRRFVRLRLAGRPRN